MVIIVILFPNLTRLVGFFGALEPLLVEVQLASGTDMPFEVHLLTAILMYLHALLHLMLAKNATNDVQFIAMIDALKLRLLLIFELSFL